MLVAILGSVNVRTGGQKSSCISTTSNAGLKLASDPCCAIGDADGSRYANRLGQVITLVNGAEVADEEEVGVLMLAKCGVNRFVCHTQALQRQYEVVNVESILVLTRYLMIDSSLSGKIWNLKRPVVIILRCVDVDLGFTSQ